MKKILFTVTTDLNFDQRMSRICQVLAENGYEVQLVGRKKRNSPPLKKRIFKQKRLNCFFEKGKLFYFEYNIRLFFTLLFTRFDIVCAIDLDTILPAYFASLFKGKPLVYDAHEYFPEMIEVVNRPVIKKVWVAVENFVVPKLKYAYTVNESIKRLFEEKYKVSFEVIRNIPPFEEFKLPDKKDKYIVYAGVVNEGRGLEELIFAMEKIDCKLIICGHGDIFDKLVQLVHQLKLETKVIFKGNVQPDDLKEILRKAYIGYLVLKNSGLSYYYSLANKFFDYMHAGIPQVTIDFPEYRILNDQYNMALLVNMNVEEITNAFNTLLQDESRYRILRENALLASRELNWQNESRRLIEFYRKVK